MIGKRLGRWTLDAEIGRGAMGAVYRARDDSGRPAAIKVLSAEMAGDELLRGRFEREVEALGHLDHPHIVKLYDFGTVDGQPFFAMQYVDGVDYERRLAALGRRPWAEVIAAGRQIAEALKHAHDRGVIHRDLKPANILLDGNPDGPGGPVVMLTDFGVAKLFSASPLTASGSFVGTAAYLAPEQAAGKPPTKRGDLYSLGCVLYALAVGRPPFPGENISELLHQHRFAQPEQPIRLVPDLPHELNALILQLLDKDPAKRPADASLLVKQFERIVRKLERQGQSTDATQSGGDTDSTQLQATAWAGKAAGIASGPGPATFAAEFVREELHRQQAMGPIGRVFNHPVVLVTLFVLCVAGIVFGLWRPRQDPGQAMKAAKTLMQSDDPADWERAYREYLRPMADVDTTYRAAADELRLRIDDFAERERALAKLEPTPSEGAFFYRQGLLRLQSGDTAGARRVWQALVKAYAEVPSEARWVSLAKLGLGQLGERVHRERKTTTAALEKARQLRDSGHLVESAAIWDGLETLYRDDPEGAAVLEAIRKDRGK